jgi:PAS domain S-box-containing protein
MMLGMFNRIRRFLAPPIFAANEEKSRNAYLLNSITISSFLAALIYEMILPAERTLYAWLAAAVSLLAWLLMKRGHIRWASIVLVSGLSIAIALAVIAAGGLNAREYSAFIVPIMFSGLLLGRRVTVAMVAASVLFGAVLFQADSFHLLPAPAHYDPAEIWIINSLYFILSGIFLTLALQSINRALHNIQRELNERKQAEVKLLQFRNVLDESNDAIFMIDPETSRYIDFNRNAYERLGYSREELSQLGVINIAKHVTSMEVWQKRVDMVRENGGLIFETVYRRKDGTTFPVEVSARMLEYEEKTILVAITRDITERKQVEDALVASEMKFRMLAETTPIVVYQCKNDNRFTFLYLNDAVEALTGYPKKSFLEDGLSFFDLYHPDDISLIALPENDLHHHRPSFHITYRIRHKSGEWRWVDEWGAYVMNEPDHEEYLVGMISDVTERKLAEKALRESEERFRKIFHSSPVAICITTLEEGRLLDANYAYWNLTGYSAEKSIGMDAKELGMWDVPEERVEFVKNLRQLGSLFNPDDYFYHTDGSRKYVISFYELIKIGAEECVLAMFHDMSAQKTTMQALQKSEERFRKIFYSSPVAICITTLEDGRLLDGNRAYWELSGYDPKTSIGKDYIELKMWDDPQDRVQFVEKISQEGAVYYPDYEFMDTKGNQKSAVAYYEIIQVGEEECVLSMFHDMSVQKATMQALQKSEARVRALLEAMPDMIFELSADGIFIDFISAQDTATFVPSENFLGKNIRDTLPPDVSSSALFAIQRALETGQLHAFEYQLPNGSEMHSYEARVMALSDQTALSIVRDITLQKQLTQDREALINELEVRNEESETLRASLASIVGTFEFTKIIDRILSQIKRVVPYDTASVWRVDGTQQIIIAGVDLPPGIPVPGTILTLDETNSAYPLSTESLPYILNNNVQEELADFQNLQDNYVNSWLAVPLKTRGKMIGLIALDGKKKDQFTEHHAQLAVTFANQVAIVLENASLFHELQVELEARKDLIAELESKNAELERFTYTVSHDLKSPLFTIRGFLGYLEKDAFSGNQERLRTDVQRISDATDKMQRLLNELLELSRIGRLKNESVNVPFDELAHEAVELVQGRIMEHNITVDIESDLPMVFGDRQRLVEVLQNLVDNAAKFMGNQKEPRIEIGQWGEEDGKPVFFVKDNGIGIQPEHHERIFGLFNKLDVKSDGTGIGLALVKRIVEVHGGRIWVESAAEKGAAFYFTLPGSTAVFQS